MSIAALPTALRAIATDYFRLVLLVGPMATGKTRTLRSFADSTGHPLVSVGSAVAVRLLELSEHQRQRRAAELVADVVDQAGAGAPVILLDDIELLFAPSLALDPLKLLQSLARNRCVVATWAGEFSDSVLAYADPSHPEHRVYRNPETVVVLARNAPAPSAA